ncbi:MAG: ABC transporter ATP-binding protein [Actinobacteria bacterium]|nr:ABC transporter ATP-binding protein [Actinomycetota bacterium]
MTNIIEVENLTRTYGKVRAVDGVSFEVEEDGIYGLLGRNGAGKTTLMQLLTAQDFATRGTIRVFGASPVENAKVLSRVCFVKESQAYPDSFKAKHVLKAAPHFFSHWDAGFAMNLVDAFKVPLDRPIWKMSRGQRSAVGVIVGLASRAPLTLFDEPYAGLDAVARHIFYDTLLADYAEHPRTILLSTHLIDEASNLLSHVLVIDEGRIIIDEDAEHLRAATTVVVGKRSDVNAFAKGRDVIGRQSLAGIESATISGLSATDKKRAIAAGLELSPVSLQQLIVSRTGGTAITEEASA